MDVQLIAAAPVQTDAWPSLVLFGRAENGNSTAVVVKHCSYSLLVHVGRAPDGACEMLSGDLSRALNSCVKYRQGELSFFIQNEADAKTFGKRKLAHFDKRKDRLCAFEFYGYDPEQANYIRLRFPDSRSMYKARSLLHACCGTADGSSPAWISPPVAAAFFRKELAERVDELHFLNAEARRKECVKDGPFEQFNFRLAEANIDYCMLNCARALHVTPSGWISLNGQGGPRVTTSKVEIQEVPKHLDKPGTAPFVVLSFDIETITKDLGNGATQFFDGDDPNAMLLCISSVHYALGGTPESVVFSLGEYDDERVHAIDATDYPVHIRYFASELALLDAFWRHIVDVDPDIITGYNIYMYDLPWLFKRCAALQIENPFPIGRLRNTCLVPDELNEKVPFSCPGRVLFDMYSWTKKNRQLRQYNLDFVALEYLKKHKLDVSYAEIGELSKTRDGMRKLSQYCELDSRLVTELLMCKSLDPLGRDISIAQVCGVFLQEVGSKGTQNLLRGKLLPAAIKAGFVLPYEPGGAGDDEEVDYKGGKVLKPHSGYYSDPVACLDFASLYPSIMMSVNLCKSTQVSRADGYADVLTPWASSLSGIYTNGTRIVDKDDEGIFIGTERYEYSNDLQMAITNGKRDGTISDCGYTITFDDGEIMARNPNEVVCFVPPSVRKGLVAQLEVDLKAERKAAKKKMAAADGSSELHTFYDNLQNSIKVVMNGLYGGLGSRKGGLFPAGFALAAAITAEGRHLICTVKQTVERFCWIKDADTFGIGEERPEDAQPVRIVYGDTGAFVARSILGH